MPNNDKYHENVDLKAMAVRYQVTEEALVQLRDMDVEAFRALCDIERKIDDLTRQVNVAVRAAIKKEEGDGEAGTDRDVAAATQGDHGAG
jgi:hypothetical protein